ncbi:MAG: glycosyltransferase [Leptolyngbyaceae cyanobacterium SL_5_9]|nr:glycosyltransferase [Leptolyngbyaceae cyanobacterium SL_5_9]NJO72541.1 glycosyltransferase [Leptolyngbyaceae cyanobacterium RM1_406_9]
MPLNSISSQANSSPSTSEYETYPKISIITPSYNQGSFIEATIQSVLSQNYPNLEYIIIDGGSTDQTIEIIKKYQSSLTCWVSESDRGQSHAINKGFDRATGEIMAWLCADDLYLPNALFTIADHFKAHPKDELIYGDGWKIDEQGNILFKFTSSPTTTLNELCKWCYVFTPGTFWRRSLWQKVGSSVDENLNYIMDWDLIIRMARERMPVKVVGDITAVRVHAQSKTNMGVSGDAKYKKQRDLEVAKLSRKYAGSFCFNSIAYELKRIAEISENLRSPKIVQKVISRILYSPLNTYCTVSGNPKSAILNN